LLSGAAATGQGDEPTTWASDAEERSTEAAASVELPPAVKDIQRRLGGPLANQFPNMQAAAQAASPWWRQFRGSLEIAPAPTPGWSAAAPANVPAGVWPNWSLPSPPSGVLPALAESPAGARPASPMIALRAVAVELDGAANRLEEFELYRQADELRQLAQRLRQDARGMAAERDAANAGPPEAAADGPVRPRSMAPPRREAPALFPDFSDPPRQGAPPRESGRRARPVRPPRFGRPIPDLAPPAVAPDPSDAPREDGEGA
jgi:hypothetical protein